MERSSVGRDEFEPKQPQLGPFRKVTDPQALKDASPETDLAEERNIQWSWNPVGAGLTILTALLTG